MNKQKNRKEYNMTIQDIRSQLGEYAKDTKDCENCSFLATCSGRNILNYMKENNLKDCLFPSKFQEII